MPNLQLHQLRVAAVAKMVCDNYTGVVDTNTVMLECLFHDMGNIVKSDLQYFPDFVEPEGFDYWQKVKDEYLQKYGPEQHAANAAIAREIGLPDRVVEIMDQTGFSKLGSMGANLELRICQYADMRVGPRGILPLEERLAEGRKRYSARKSKAHAPGSYEELLRAAHELEKNIFVHVTVQPTDITEETIVPLIEELWDYPIS
jgi:hypothetical protein